MLYILTVVCILAMTVLFELGAKYEAKNKKGL